MSRPTNRGLIAARVLVVLLGGLLLAYAVAIAPAALPGDRDDVTQDRLAAAEPNSVSAGTEAGVAAEPSPSSPPAPQLFPPAGKAFIGVMTEKGPYDFAAVDKFTAAAKRQPQVMLFSAGWASDRFDRKLFDRISGRGMLPMLGWEPWDYQVDETTRKKGLPRREIDKIRSEQARYQLSRIARGDFDDYLRSWAEGIKSLGYPVAMRFAHEMNGDWYPWCETANGNRPGDYVKAWRHVHDVFRTVGAGNVIWVWSPNVRWSKDTPKLATLYPGDGYVDWVGVNGYYGTGAFSKYRSFDAIFNETINEIRAFTGKPLVVTETGASDVSGRKAEWIEQTFQMLPAHKDIIGLVWFEVDKEQDWRIASSPAAATAFAQAVAAPRYDFTWSPELRPRTKLDE
ncbi:Glycosyl hydrolase family 26 [Micromonospora viridifaciens]|uniref:Glycosyl hydrolase family 26 n=1 Tax=Micromonospora viridifaciens TaxID=1881 RepID=A0A1C4XID1_MICVI|nr:glycosyl hydrolase [Micromonospora viridifaciens]SCF08146.1 Glycosyl hydrolase family 26 [Micromonospora viridifaciens]